MRRSWLPAALAPILALGAAGCISTAPRSAEPSAAARVLDGVPVRRFGVQECGAGALSAVLTHLGEPVSVEELSAALPKGRNNGVLSLDLVLEARERGFDAHLVAGDRRRIEETLAAGRPAILMLKVFDTLGRGRDLYHYVVVDGIDPGRDLVRVQFGDGKARWAPLERLEKPWAKAAHTTILIAPRDPAAIAAAGANALRYAAALEAVGRPQEAIPLYRRLLDEGRESPLLWINLGNAHAAGGSRQEAESAYRRALELDPDAGDAANNLAWLLLEEGERLAEAEQLARRAAGGDADRHLALDTLGRVLAARGDCDAAAAAFVEALAAAPAGARERGALHLGLGQALAACGRPEEARAVLERAAADGDEATRDAAGEALRRLP